MLDVKDRRLLFAIETDARASFKQLGKKSGLSKETAIYRIRRLEEKGVIARYTALVNFASLHRDGFAVYHRFSNLTEDEKNKIIGEIKKIPEVYWIALVGGRFDIAIGLLCESITEFNELHYKIRSRYASELQDSTISIRTELRQHKRNYLIDTPTPTFHAPFFGGKTKTADLDDLDEKILTRLAVDARIPTTKLAQVLDAPASTIALRMRKLERTGVIQGYWTYIRPHTFGMQSYRLLLHLENMDEKTRQNLFRYANDNPHALLAIETVGEWNFEITLEVESHEHLQSEISALRNAFPHNITKLEFLIMFEDDLIYDTYPFYKNERDN